MENTVKVYDSAYSDLPHEEEMVVASVADNLRVLFPNVSLQTNGYDCGLYSESKCIISIWDRSMRAGVYSKNDERAFI